METEINTANDFLEEYKDYSLKELNPCVDVLLGAYSYEKDQSEIASRLLHEKYEQTVNDFKLRKQMALRSKPGLQCAQCGKDIMKTLEEGVIDSITLFGCGHAVHKSCYNELDCPVKDCWKNVSKKHTTTRSKIAYPIKEKSDKSTLPSKEEGNPLSIEEIISDLNKGEFSGSSSTTSVVAPPPSAIYRRKWLLKAVSMSSGVEMEIPVSCVSFY